MNKNKNRKWKKTKKLILLQTRVKDRKIRIEKKNAKVKNII